MGDQIAETVKIGLITVLLGSIISIILSLMSTSSSLMATGVTGFNSGATKITKQQYMKYNGDKIYGTDVKAALDLYIADDIALIVRTEACTKGKAWSGSDTIYAYNYGALLKGAALCAAETTNDMNGWQTGDQALYIIKKPASGSTPPIVKLAGNSYYTHDLQTTNGIIDTSGNLEAVDKKGRDSYILDSARFLSELIYDNTGELVGISFTQQ